MLIKCFERGIVGTAIFPEAMYDTDKMKKMLKAIADTKSYEWVELYFEGSPKDLMSIGNTAESLQFNVVFLGGYPMKTKKWNIGDINKEKRLLNMNYTKKLIDDAYCCKAKKMLILSGTVYEKHENNINSLKLLKESIRELCQYAYDRAEKYIVEIVLEFFNDVGEPYLLAGPVEMAKEIAEEVKKDFSNFGLTFDTSHVIQLKSNLRKSFILLENHVRHIHYANCVTSNTKSPFWGDKHPPLDLLEGDLSIGELTSFTRFLEERFRLMGGQVKPVPLSAEVITPSGADALELFQSTTECLKKCL